MTSAERKERKALKSQWPLRCLWLLVSLALVVLDQWTKSVAAQNLKKAPFVLIDGVLELTYAENTGAAWSMLSGKQTFLIVLTTLMLCALLYVLVWGKWGHITVLLGESMLIAGGVGNLIDRAFKEYVTDFIYVKAIHFPVFNLADCCVCCGAALLVVYVIFFEERDMRGNKASAAVGNDGGTAGQNGSAGSLGDEGDGTKVD